MHFWAGGQVATAIRPLMGLQGDLLLRVALAAAELPSVKAHMQLSDALLEQVLLHFFHRLDDLWTKLRNSKTGEIRDRDAFKVSVNSKLGQLLYANVGIDHVPGR